MKTSDVALLVFLGTARSGPATLEEMFEAVRTLAPEIWRPTPEILRIWAERAIAWGELRQVSDGENDTGPAFETTEVGQAVIVDLLRMPIGPSCGNTLPACMSAKLCFLHHLPRAERRVHGERLGRLYREAIATLRRRQGLPAGSSGLTRAGLSDEIVRMDSELASLDAMRGMRDSREGLDGGNRRSEQTT